MLVSGNRVTTGTCGAAKRVDRAVSYCPRTAAPMVARGSGTGFDPVSLPVCSVEAVAVAGAEPDSEDRSPDGAMRGRL